MQRLLVSAVAALMLGAIATFVSIDQGWLALQPGRAVTTVIDDVPEVSLAEAEVQRNSHFVAIGSIEDVLALPGSFARAEALHVLAGRSDSAAVQDLIFQARGIEDSAERDDILRVLFSRLAELDAPSALALAESGGFSGQRGLEAAVWTSWGKLDLDSALSAAAKLEPASRRDRAGQALLAAYGYWGNRSTRRIADALDVAPDSATRAAHLRRLADEDPAAAVAWINDLDRAAQREAAALLGEHFGRSGIASASRYTRLFEDESLRRAYTVAVAKASARAEPEAALEALLSDTIYRQTGQSRAAIQELVDRDPERALAFLEQTDNPRRRELLADAVAVALAREDPRRALAWARDNDRSMHRGRLANVLSTIALEDPELAVAEAKRLPDSLQKKHALNVLAMTVARNDPRQATELLDNFEDTEDRISMATAISNTWLQSDPDAALAWILDRTGSEREKMLAMAAQLLPQMDIDSAMRWLPRLDDGAAAAWRAQIAAHLAMQRSAGEAERFIARFEGSEEYPRLQASVINGVARYDPDSALEMVRRMPRGSERDSLYSNLAMQVARQDPRRAAAVLASIDDPGRRSGTVGSVAMQWGRKDPPAAEQWARNLPRGEQRDDAIAHLAGTWEEITPSRRLMLDSIGSSEKRKQALMGHAYRLARSNPQEAERLIQGMDLSDADKQQMLRRLDQFRHRQAGSTFRY